MAEKGKPPIERIQVGGVKVAIWENKGKEGTKFYGATTQRGYKDKDGNWKNTDSLKINDIPKAREALRQAYIKMIELQQANRAENSEDSNGEEGE